VGLGFPITRMGALFGLASGGVHAYEVTACKGMRNGEQTLLQSLTAHLHAHDALLADARLATCWNIEVAQRRGRMFSWRRRQTDHLL
jgi:hypothetical protein